MNEIKVRLNVEDKELLRVQELVENINKELKEASELLSALASRGLEIRHKRDDE